MTRTSPNGGDGVGKEGRLECYFRDPVRERREETEDEGRHRNVPHRTGKEIP